MHDTSDNDGSSENQGTGPSGNDKGDSQENPGNTGPSGDKLPKQIPPGQRFIFRPWYLHHVTKKRIYPKNARVFRIPVDDDGSPIWPGTGPETNEDPKGPSK